MRINEVIKRRVREATDGLRAEADVDATIAANVGEPGATTTRRNRSTIRVSQRARSQAGGPVEADPDEEGTSA